MERSYFQFNMIPMAAGHSVKIRHPELGGWVTGSKQAAVRFQSRRAAGGLGQRHFSGGQGEKHWVLGAF